MTEQQLPTEIMKQAVKGISYIAHPLRLQILEFLDVNGEASVSKITKAVKEEQMIVSQSLKKLRDAGLVIAQRHGIFIYYRIQEEYPASIFECLRKLYGYMTDNIRFLADGYKAVLPTDYTTMAANRIKLFANYDKMRILEFLLLHNESNVTEIVQGINSSRFLNTCAASKMMLLSSAGAMGALSITALLKAFTKPRCNAFANAMPKSAGLFEIIC